MSDVNLKQEMESIMNGMSVDDVDVENKTVKKVIEEYGKSKEEYVAGLLKETKEMAVTLATGMKMSLTGKDGFKELQEFEDFIREFHLCSESIKGMEHRLVMMMSDKISNAGDEGKVFMKSKRKEVAAMMVDKLKEMIEGEE